MTAARVFSNQPVALTEQEDSLTHYQEEEEGYEQYGQYDDQYGQQQVDLDMGQTQGGGELGKGEGYIFQLSNNYSSYVNDEQILELVIISVISLVHDLLIYFYRHRGRPSSLTWAPPRRCISLELS